MHLIRLRKPWEKKSLQGTGLVMRVDVPDSEPLSHEDLSSENTSPGVLSPDPAPQQSHSEQWEYRRKFNLPSGLTPSSRVSLRISQWDGVLESVTVNELPVEVTGAPLDVEITPMLQKHNHLVVRLASGDTGETRLSGEVSLAIDDHDD